MSPPPRLLPMEPELKGMMGEKTAGKTTPPVQPRNAKSSLPCPLPLQRARLQLPVYNEHPPPNRHLCTPFTTTTEKHAPGTPGASITTTDKSGMLKSLITPLDIESP